MCVDLNICFGPIRSIPLLVPKQHYHLITHVFVVLPVIVRRHRFYEFRLLQHFDATDSASFNHSSFAVPDNLLCSMPMLSLHAVCLRKGLSRTSTMH